jgi:hypothetical protein
MKKLRNKFIKNLRYLFLIGISALGLMTIIATGGDDGESAPWPTDYGTVFSKFISDPTDDFVFGQSDSPPYPVSYPPVDVTLVSLGVQGKYFYIRVDYADVTPTLPVNIPENPPVEAQIVGEHDTSIVMDVDNDDLTGCSGVGIGGVDVMFQVRFDYGNRVNVHVAYDCPPGSGDNYQTVLPGSWGEGGPGHDYVIFRFNTSNLGNFFPRGANVEVDGWAEAMSFSGGRVLYHHFAFDELTPTTWTLPE